MDGLLRADAAADHRWFGGGEFTRELNHRVGIDAALLGHALWCLVLDLLAVGIDVLRHFAGKFEIG